MRAVVQRVTSARVEVAGELIGAIEEGIVVLVGVAHDDTGRDVDYLVDKIANLRIFEDQAGKMNLALADIGGQVLAVSQFTLMADVRKGRRPSFTEAAPPDKGKELFDQVVAGLRGRGLQVETGEFGASMKVYFVNHGPCTIIIDSRQLKEGFK